MDKGVVIKIDAQFAYINMRLNSSCKSCSGRGICFAGDKPLPLKVINNFDLRVGDQVEVEMQPATRLVSAFLLFILPLIFLATGYILGIKVKNQELYGIIGSIIGLSVSFILLKIINSKAEKSLEFKPVSIRKTSRLNE